MKRLYVMSAALPLLALIAAAQEDPERIAKLKAELDSYAGQYQMKVVGFAGAAMGAAVKGAPYSAVEVTENSQVLADGTRIHNERQTSVYRDSEGRVRRETGNEITILDPVAGVSYFLNPKTQTATKVNLTKTAFNRRPVEQSGGVVHAGQEPSVLTYHATADETFHLNVTKDGPTTITLDGKTIDPSAVATHTFTVNGEPVDDKAFAAAQDKMKAMKAEMAVAAGADGVLRRRINNPGNTESLGKRMMEGVNAEGMRTTSTLEAGAIGNDRPIQIINERWFSPELNLMVMTKHSDPRTGEEIFRLTNINRGEPGVDLFQVPTSYQISGGK